MRWTIVALVILVAIWPSYAYAYLDPAVGGMFLQVLFGGIAVVLVGFKLFWSKLRSIVLRVKSLGRRGPPEGGEGEETDVQQATDKF